MQVSMPTWALWKMINWIVSLSYTYKIMQHFFLILSILLPNILLIWNSDYTLRLKKPAVVFMLFLTPRAFECKILYLFLKTNTITWLVLNHSNSFFFFLRITAETSEQFAFLNNSLWNNLSTHISKRCGIFLQFAIEAAPPSFACKLVLNQWVFLFPAIFYKTRKRFLGMTCTYVLQVVV